MGTSTHTPLSINELRGLMRGAKGGFAHDHVAQCLIDRKPSLVEKDAPELARVLKDLVDAARAKLHDDGLEPLLKGKGRLPRLPKRERDKASNLSRLLRFNGSALLFAGRRHEAEEIITEAIGWARTGNDLLEESSGWRTLAQIYQFSGRLVEEETALTNAVDLARSLGNPILILEQMREIIAALIAHDKQALASTFIEEAFELTETIPEEHRPRFVPQLLTQKGRIAALQKNEREAIATFREALRLSDEALDPTGHAAILTQLGMAYAGLGDIQHSLEYQREMVRVAEKYGEQSAYAWGLFRIGEAYAALDDTENAEKAFTLSWNNAPEASNQPGLHILSKRAQFCLQDGRIEEGIEFCHRVLEMCPEREAPFLAIFNLMNLGLLEEKRGNFLEAEHYLHRALQLGTETETADRSININVYLSKVLLQQGREEEAREFLERTCDSAIRTIGDERAVTEAYEMLADLMERKEAFREALHYTKKHKEHASRVTEKQTEEALYKARVLAEVELYEREAQFERERRRQMEHELAEAIVSLDNRKQVIERVEKQLQKTLSFLASEKAREVVGTLKSVLMEIDSEDEEKEHALQYLHSIDKEFSFRLRERWPDLTRKQERLCGLIRAGLTSQEIIKLLGLSHEGLRAQRKRLRKALGLESDVTLETVIGEV